MKNFWKKYHKWVGLFFSFFILMFCFSGIVLNHRQAFSGMEVSRKWMPRSYGYKNWNNGIVKGTLRLPAGDVLIYGNAGVWRTDSCFAAFTDFNDGLDAGIDNRKISNIIRMDNGDVWCAGLYAVYKLEHGRWKKYPVAEDEERISDVSFHGDSLIVLSRSHIYVSVAPYEKGLSRVDLQAPAGYSPEVSLFRTVWLLHSGELFGTPGKLLVDALGIILIVLCITGVIYMFLPYAIRRRKRKQLPAKTQVSTLKFSLKWHNKLGAWLIILTVLLAVTGMCLRPPLMIPLAMNKVKPLPGSVLDSSNPWHDKLRCIRWDDWMGSWLLSSSEGFYQLNDFDAVPVRLKKAPPVSPMGVNVFIPDTSDGWLVGSFSGLFRWNPSKGEVTDYFTNEPPVVSYGRPVGRILVTGFSNVGAGDIVFDYSKGAMNREGSVMFTDMPPVLQNQPMSLWNFCLELHVGRCYTPFLGVFSELFVFLSGLILTFILISGYIVYRKHHVRKKKPKTA